MSYHSNLKDKKNNFAIGIPIKKFNSLAEQAISSAKLARSECFKHSIKCEIIIVSSDPSTYYYFDEWKMFGLRCFFQEPSGIYPAFNHIILNSRSDYIMILGSDDYIFEPSALAMAIASIYQSPWLAINPSVFVSPIFIGNSLHDYQVAINKVHLFNNLRSQSINHPGMIVSTQVYEKVGLYNCEIGPEADYDFCLRLIKVGIPITILDAPFIFHRLGGVSSSKQKSRIQSHIRCCFIIARHFPIILFGAALIRFASYLFGSTLNFFSISLR